MPCSVPQDLLDRLVRDSVEVRTGRAGTLRLVSEEALKAAAAEGGSGGPAARRDLELALLARGVVPRRYLRNVDSLGLDGQARLLRARVGVAGLGGLGGLVSELLARAGVGELVLVDPDVTSDDNLNRQLLADEENLGRAKVDAAAARLGAVNSATTVITFRLRGDAETFSRIFCGAAVLVDCLDSIPARFALEDAARSLGVPLVHGAVGGFSGHVTCVFPDDPGLEALYGPRAEAAAQGVESVVGTPSPTPAVVAALEVTEVLKIIAGVGEPLRRKLLTFDTASPYFAVVEL